MSFSSHTRATLKRRKNLGGAGNAVLWLVGVERAMSNGYNSINYVVGTVLDLDVPEISDVQGSRNWY